MRILMLSHGYPPTISGVSLVVQKIAREMVKRGHEVTVVTGSDRKVAYRSEDQGVILRRVRSAPNPFWAEGPLPIIGYEKFREIIAEVEPDVINTHDGALLSLQLFRLEDEKSHIPEILTCHYLPRFVTYYVNIGDIVERVIENIAWEFTLRMINGFDHVIFPTQSQQRIFVEAGLEKPSTVISNGLDTNRYAPYKVHDDDVEKRYRLPPRPRILFVGRIAKDKKIDVIIRAMRTIWPSQQGHLLLVGRGDDRDHLEDLTAALNLQHCVHFLGFVPEEDLPSLYRQCDVFAIASDVEVQSIPTLQAVATGLPIVAADAGALPELVQNGRNGFLVPPDNYQAFGEALRKILTDPEMAADFGQASLSHRHSHSEESTFQSYEALYQGFWAVYRSQIASEIVV